MVEDFIKEGRDHFRSLMNAGNVAIEFVAGSGRKEIEARSLRRCLDAVQSGRTEFIGILLGAEQRNDGG